MKKIIAFIAALAVIAVAVSFTAEARKARKSTRKPPIEQVILTGDLAKDVIGYQGPTPLKVTIKEGKITDIEAILPNKETPRYFERATKHVFPQYIGKTVYEARTLEGDIATGATYSSEALIANIKAAASAAK